MYVNLARTYLGLLCKWEGRDAYAYGGGHLCRHRAGAYLRVSAPSAEHPLPRTTNPLPPWVKVFIFLRFSGSGGQSENRLRSSLPSKLLYSNIEIENASSARETWWRWRTIHLAEKCVSGKNTTNLNILSDVCLCPSLHDAQ
jgi:hypothetical protein